LAEWRAAMTSQPPTQKAEVLLKGKEEEKEIGVDTSAGVVTCRPRVSVSHSNEPTIRIEFFSLFFFFFFLNFFLSKFIGNFPDRIFPSSPNRRKEEEIKNVFSYKSFFDLTRIR
jgi:hypothetical protein